MMQESELLKLLALNHSAGVGPQTVHELLAKDPVLSNVPAKYKLNWEKAEQDLDWRASNSDANIITILDSSYPPLLREIAHAPAVLYVLGDPAALLSSQLAMVGSRRATAYGSKTAHDLAASLTNSGFTITSGLAIGIDSASHAGALSNPMGTTIAVLATGIDKCYPPSNIELAGLIRERGCLVSEFALGTDPVPGLFPRRNRIIAGLSLGVLVVEATQNSGSMISASYALEQNREVFAVPGNIQNLNTRGCHQLIRQGAKLVETAEDVTAELQPLMHYANRGVVAEDNKESASLSCLPMELRQVLKVIDYEATCMDSIVVRCGLGLSRLNPMLVELEIRGAIKSLPGGYCRTVA